MGMTVKTDVNRGTPVRWELFGQANRFFVRYLEWK